MTDQELDILMRRVLLDALKLDTESTAGGELAFEATPQHRRQMAAMIKDPLKWARRRARPIWKNVIQKVAVILLVFSLSLGEPDGGQPHGPGRSGTLGHGMVRDTHCL